MAGLKNMWYNCRVEIDKKDVARVYSGQEYLGILTLVEEDDSKKKKTLKKKTPAK